MTDRAATHASRAGDSFGFELPDEEWLGRVRRAEAAGPLGRVGAYELLAELGRGAQGVVYKARQPHTGRVVALKRIGAGAFATAGMRARFEREIRSLAALQHPGVVGVLGVDEVDGQRVLLMEWIDGRPIDQWARDHPIKDIAEILARACDAVHHAHQRGVIHRDLKPAHILVDESGAPRVLDFGLAKLLEESGDSPTHAGTRASAFVGTPAYAAPEQVTGSSRVLDTRTDVYALGAILYQLLAGSPPFDPAADLASLFDAIRRGTPIPPSARRPAAGPELDAIVLKAMAVEPEHRYQSVEALGGDIRRFLAGQTVLAHPPTAAYHLRKFVRRHRTAVSLGSGFVVLTLAFAIVAATLAIRLSARQEQLAGALQRERGALAQAREAQRAESEAARAAQQASERAVREGERHRDAATFLYDTLAGVSEIQARGPNVPVRDVLARAEQQLTAGALARQPDVEVMVRATLSTSFRNLGMYADAARVSERMCELAGEAERWRALDIHGRNLELLGRVAEAEAAMREAIRLRTEPPGRREPPAVAGLYCDLASVLHEQGRFEEAADYYQRGMALHAAAGRPTAAARRNLSLELIELGRYDEAEPHIRRALDEHLASAPARNAVQRAKRNLARILHARGQLAEAESLMREALDEWAGDAGDDHPEVARDAAYLAAIVADRGRVNEALDIYRRAAATLDQRLPAHHHWAILTRLGAAHAMMEHVSPEQAEPVLREALDGALRAQPGSERLIAQAAAGLGECLLAQQRPDEAARVAAEALAVLDVRPPPGEGVRAARRAALESIVRRAMEAR